MNIGATTPEDDGLYFAWGETTGYKGDASDGHVFDWNSYKLCVDGEQGKLKKYNWNSEYGIVDNKQTLEAEDDAARANWGGEWRMPTQKDVEELLENTVYEWISANGIYGHRFTSKTNGNTLFLPASGSHKGTYFSEGGGCYWTSSLGLGQSSWILYFTYLDRAWSTFSDRCNGNSVRPVCGGNSSSGSGSGNNGGDTSPVWGKVTGTISAIGPGVAYSSEASFADGKSTTVDYVYYPTTDSYYVYGGTFCSQPDVNDGKGLRYDAKKGYNSITIKYGFYYDYSTKIRYDWELRLRVTLP